MWEKRTRSLYLHKIGEIYGNNPKIEEYDRRLLPKEAESAKSFWRAYGLRANPLWHAAYASVNGTFDPRYVPEDLFYSYIEPRLNRMDLAEAYADKNSYARTFASIRMPKTILRNVNGKYYLPDDRPINLEEVGQHVLSCGSKRFIVKPAMYSWGGQGVDLFHAGGGEIRDVEGRATTVEEIAERYNQDFIVQERLPQEKSLENLHENSLNTVRAITLRVDGEVHLLSCVLRMGNNGACTDNQASGGVSCGVNKDGDLNSYAIDKNLVKYDQHPYSGHSFPGTIPSMCSAISMAEEAHRSLRYFDIVSWDIGINRNREPVLIEVNLKDQEINFHQASNGPLFGIHTDRVLQAVSDRETTLHISIRMA